MKSKGRFRLIKAVLLAIMVISLIPVVQAYYLSWEHERQWDELRESLLAEENVQGDRLTKDTDTSTKDPSIRAGVSEEADVPGLVMLQRFEKLYEENHDLAAWLSIEGMSIDYPVMQCEDDEYYLHHDFYGNADKYGCLYVRNSANVNSGTNFIIYGHDMKDGSMFGDLDLYQKESFYLEHPMISFDTLYEERTYEIIAVFRSQVYSEGEEVFKYYEFYQADTQEEFDDFYRNIKEVSLYDTGVTAEFGDTFLTLSTCDYYVEDGRFVVVAKRIMDASRLTQICL
ncbi:MAG: class B sortase [Acetatifactor sp.]|nr:class B sortase [Acetatifactor sp.]